MRGRRSYALRQQIPKPVFGQVRTVQGIRQSPFRTKRKVGAE
jgi:hypothetical protein